MCYAYDSLPKCGSFKRRPLAQGILHRVPRFIRNSRMNKTFYISLRARSLRKFHLCALETARV